MRTIFEEYIGGSEALMPFFAGAPRDVFRAQLANTGWEPSLVEELRGYQGAIGATAGLDGNEVAVVTGQQPGLFTGPAYTVYKAATAILLARTIGARSGVRCVPVFWLASDDHDFQESRTAHFLTKAHEPLSLSYDPAQDVEGRPMHSVPLEKSLHALIEQAAAATRGSELRAELAAFLHETLDASGSLAEWTARLLARLFSGTPLVIFSPHLPVARLLAAEILARDIAAPLVSTRLLSEAGRRLAERGFVPQIKKRAAECGFFFDVCGRRRKVLFERDRYRLPQENLSYTVDEMLGLLAASPERFSPNVALRCVVQQRLFPAVAYVGGPGEIAYWAQLKPLFDHLGEPMPIVYPRVRAVLTTPKLRGLMREFGFTLDDLAGDPQALVERAVRATANSGGVHQDAAQCRMAVEASLRALREGLAEAAPTAATMTESLRARVSVRLERIERTVLMQDKARVEAVETRFRRLCNSLMPWRRPQERVYTIFSFMFEQGWDFVPRLLEALDVESFQWNEVEL